MANGYDLNSGEFPPRLASVFRALRMGRHLSRHHGEDYYDLERHYDRYSVVFEALGYTLVQHDQGFYYFSGESVLRSQRLRATVLFVLILFQDLEDKKFNQDDRSWERTLLDQRFALAELPHFATAQRRTLMHAVGIAPDTLDSKVLRFMSTLGIIEMTASAGFRFLPPVYRFVDLFLVYADDESWTKLAEQPQEDDKADDLLEDDEDVDAEVNDE
jgi:hypothetical protein